MTATAEPQLQNATGKDAADFERIVDKLKTAKLRGDEAIRDAVDTINEYQTRFGNSRERLKLLAKAVGVDVVTLYRWKRQVEEPNATPKKKAAKKAAKKAETRSVAYFNWRDHWHDMPEYRAEDKRPARTVRVWLPNQKPPAGKPRAFVTVHFKNDGKAVDDFVQLIKLSGAVSIPDKKAEYTLSNFTEEGLGKLLFKGEHKIAHHSCWIPWKENEKHSDFVYRQKSGNAPVNPKYPVYVISKGRWESLLTVRALDRMGVPHTLVVEPKEFRMYEAAAKSYKFCTLHKAEENFSELGCGSIPVRNYVWELALKASGKDGRHWLMDDNIPTFNRTHENLAARVETGAIFRAVEVFTDRYENVALAGLQNSQFVISKWVWPALVVNTRVYSCTLIKNALDLRMDAYTADSVRVPACTDPHWRGRYNEDTDLCIRALKKGWCTILFNTFNADKVGTMTMKGGNTDELYAGDGRKKMAESLAKQHPDVARVGKRWNRAQHIVNYPSCIAIGRASGKNGGCELQLKPSADNFGMVLESRQRNETECAA